MRENDLVKAFRSRRDQLTEIPSVSVGDMLAAREDLAVLEKTSNASVRKATKTPLNKVGILLIGVQGCQYLHCMLILFLQFFMFI